MKIAYTKHAMVTLEERGIERGMVRELLKHPQQIVKATAGKEIAQGIFKRAVKTSFSGSSIQEREATSR